MASSMASLTVKPLGYSRWRRRALHLVDGFYVARISEVADFWEGVTLRSDASNEFSCCSWQAWFSKRGSLAGTVTCIWCLQGPTTSCEELPTVLLSEYSSGAPF